jgi:hypothetical protein
MRVVILYEKAERLAARKRELRIEAARFEAARNTGTSRTPAKRALLKSLQAVADQQRRRLPFPANF